MHFSGRGGGGYSRYLHLSVTGEVDQLLVIYAYQNENNDHDKLRNAFHQKLFLIKD